MLLQNTFSSLLIFHLAEIIFKKSQIRKFYQTTLEIYIFLQSKTTKKAIYKPWEKFSPKNLDLGSVVLSHDAADVVGGLDQQTRVAHLLLVRVPWILDILLTIIVLG